MGHDHLQRYERAPVAVCWTTPRQAWLLINVSDREATTSRRAMFVEVFTQPLDEDEWQWRDAYYPDDAAKRGFWAHQFAETGTPRSFDLEEEQPQLPEIRPPQHPPAEQASGEQGAEGHGSGGLTFLRRIAEALRR